MKRFWLVLLSLGLIVAFSTSAMAVDVKFSGEYYAAGMYLDQITLQKYDQPSTAFYYQRLRLNTTFIVHPGLFLITRADIMERVWGAARSTSSAALDLIDNSAGTRAENENIAFDLLYVQYISPIGVFLAGYQIDGAWGTVFGNTSIPTPKIGYLFISGPVTAGIQAGKNVDAKGAGGERSSGTFGGAVNNASARDDDFVTALGIFKWKTGEAGLLAKYFWLNANRNLVGATNPAPSPLYDTGLKTQYLVLSPYAKATFGPVAVQTQLYWLTGKQQWEGRPDLIGKQDVDMNAYSFWIDAKADFGMVYAGGTFAYVSGDDPGTADKVEGAFSGGLDWNPCLILFNSDMAYWQGGQAGFGTGIANGAGMTNAWFFQGNAGVRPIDKLDIMASVSYANADKKPAGVVNNAYGWEVDVTGTYKITNNLSYMIGGGYLFTGNYFKGASDDNNVSNNYLVINKLTLTF